jgi:hypothetical protein
MYTNLKTFAHTYITKHTHTPLSQTTAHGALLASAGADGAGFTLHKNIHIANQSPHKQELMWGVHNARKLEDLLEMHPQLFVMLGINLNSHNAFVWGTTRFS